MSPGSSSTVAISVSACCEPLVISSSPAPVGSPRAVSRAATAARSAGSPSVVEYCSERPAAASVSTAANAARSPAASNSSGAGSPPANEIIPGRSVSARISRTGDDWTSRSRAASGGAAESSRMGSEMRAVIGRA